MELAALDDGVVEHVVDGTAQRAGAVDHDQDRPGSVQAALPQPDQQVGHHGGVLGRALGQRQDLGPRISVMPSATTQQCSATRITSTMSATRSSPVRSWASRSARACSVRATNRREAVDLEVPQAACWTLLPTGSKSGRVATGGELGEHPLQRQLTEQLGRSEEARRRAPPPHRYRQSTGPGRRTRTRRPPRVTTPCSLPAHGSPVGVVAALGASQLGDVLGHQHLHDLEARPYRKREQAFAGGSAGQLGEGNGDGLGQRELRLAGGGVVRILRHGGPLLVERLGSCPTPTTRQASGGDRHLKFYGDWDNLVLTRSTDTGREKPDGPG